MKVGIVGVGTVGGALQYGFRRIGHEVVCYDINRTESHISDVIDTVATFVCVPTPSTLDGACDVSRVEDVVGRLARFYRGVVVIKSTVVPGTTERFIELYPDLRLVFCPEFLREKAAYSDFVENHEICIIGTNDEDSYELVKAIHGPLPRVFVQLSPTEAELAKYFCNAFNATRIIFASQFFEVCEALGASYDAILSAVSRRASIGGHYLECNENFRAFGGACLPKDLAALAAFVRAGGINAKLFEWILHENERIGPPSRADWLWRRNVKAS